MTMMMTLVFASLFLTSTYGLVARTIPKVSRFTLRMSSISTKSDFNAMLSHASRDARGLAIDAISACKSGHLGLPLGCAEIGAELWGKHLEYFPEDPKWINRDRFVLSAGHGSMFLYAWLHLSGHALSLDDIKNFRKFQSKTPGHPEFPSTHHNTPGVEATTGPLGAGIGNAVGMAAAAKMAAAKYNTKDHEIIDHHVIALCGDGCLQEGVSFEAASFAAHEGLDNLIVIYDSNNVTLDKMADFTQSENHAARFEALGWNTISIDGHDFSSIDNALSSAKSNQNGKPTIIIAKTIIGKGIQEVQGKNSAHGEAGVTYQKQARQNLGLPENELFHVSDETKRLFEERKNDLKASYLNWQTKFDAWKKANPSLADELQSSLQKKYLDPKALFASIPSYNPQKNVATRQSGSDILQFISKAVPQFVSGSADLHSSNKNYINDAGNFGNPLIKGKSYLGKNFFFGIREHGMGTILNGIAYYGLNIPSGSTFLAFSDYMRAAIRIAALSELQVTYIFTHDSIGVGEDGPTHQPVETTSALRIIPNLDVIRPADPEETAGAYVAAIEKKTGPSALILSRQNLRTLNEIPVETRREGVLKGGYIALKEASQLTHIILSTGSELQIALEAAKELGPGVRVVSMPCFERFDRQSKDYKESVLPSFCTKRIAIEAGVSNLWYKYVGLEGKVIGTDAFGFSAPAEILMKQFGITKENLISQFKSL